MHTFCKEVNTSTKKDLQIGLSGSKKGLNFDLSESVRTLFYELFILIVQYSLLLVVNKISPQYLSYQYFCIL